MARPRLASRDGFTDHLPCPRCGGPRFVEALTDLVCLHCGERRDVDQVREELADSGAARARAALGDERWAPEL